MKVYFVGTSNESGWREYLVGRKNVLDLSHPESEYILQRGIPLVDELIYCGPYFPMSQSEAGCQEETSKSVDWFEIECQSICHSDIIFAYINPSNCVRALYQLQFAKQLKRPIFLYLDEALDKRLVHDLKSIISLTTSVKQVPSVMKAFEEFRESFKTNRSTRNCELLSAEQTLQLIPLVEEASRYLNLLTRGYRGELEEVTEEEFDHLSAQEADQCISLLTWFLTRMEVLKSARNEAEVMQCLAELSDIEKVRLRSARFHSVMREFQCLIHRFYAYDLGEIWSLLRRGTRHRPARPARPQN